MAIGKKKSNNSPQTISEPEIWSFIISQTSKSCFLCIALFAVFIRLAVALHPYSGANTPPIFGDYEAQRHWMEITINLPPKDWYRNSTVNDLKYWGLDYPPLTAYQSYFHGILLRFFDPASVALSSSRGYESYIGKLLMRWTVLMSDLMIFFPAVLYFVTVYYSGNPDDKKSSKAWHILMILLNPCLILIDHGHFQYNCISLGLTAAAVAAILSNRDLVGSMLFCLALNHKQMSTYYAPAFFTYLLGKCLRRQRPIVEVLKLGLLVLGTFALVWCPYLNSVDAFLEVLSRLAPFERVSTCLPSMIQLVWSPTKRGFLHGLLNCSFSFYLFSFQVHEKSILLPLLPASFLAVEEPFVFQWFIHSALLSMFPLLRRDNLVLPYAALYGLFVLLYHAPGVRKDARVSSSIPFILKLFASACSLVIHIVYITVTPPEKYPFLFEAVIMSLCFSQFVLILIYINIKQWAPSKISSEADTKKKRL
ncbi:probable dolichyl pyrophosphate Man9GlcNAc2 alpha-1,3-glucosyltransferase isoform X2 [Salvia splendens]|uniref:probable dolichyl pyrophosphate Man9GlcNAc2 alpha-1,3-glucosyltransferase isoform X2 n=1 Tax=Salvia splendens TaxID=180675 RepID=UPI001C28146C|nr:probable dolichyl pyrophosphate Man9GlcNAc2 alpha-1,3-glucosyltransferase isoform X2 [Salvia splendens]